MLAWYLCSYDTKVEILVKDNVPHDTILRVCAITRYIPAIPNPEGFTWNEVEILGNHTLVDVDADEAMHARLAADPDFTPVPDTLEGTDRTRVRDRLEALGYTRQELTATQWDLAALRETLTAVASPITKSEDGRSVVVLPGRRSKRGQEDAAPRLLRRRPSPKTPKTPKTTKTTKTTKRSKTLKRPKR